MVANTYTPSYTTIETGQVVALVLHQPVAGLACYVGEVQTVDARGVRLTLVDGPLTGFDFFAPWTNVEGALVATAARSGNGLVDFKEQCEDQAERTEHSQPVAVRHYDQG
jgi:hypothetical protein